MKKDVENGRDRREEREGAEERVGLSRRKEERRQEGVEEENVEDKQGGRGMFHHIEIRWINK